MIIMDVPQVRSMIAAVIAAIDGAAAAPVSGPPPGFVYVNPTGPQGSGKTRLWPQPHPEQGELLLGYATRCMNVIDATTGLPYYQPGRYGPILQGAGAGAPNMADALDRITYPTDWMTQPELDAQAAQVARDKAGGDHFSPG
jgi:hypothetical protein